MIVGMIDQDRGLRILIGWNRFFLKLFQIKISFENENQATYTTNGCIFILLNQTSLLDGPIEAMMMPLPWRAIVNIEYALIPIFGWAMWIFFWVIIRQWPRQARKTLQKVESYLQEGGNLLMSIEGRRSKDGLLSPYKKGPIVLAIEAKAKIVPVIHYGVQDCLPYGKLYVRPGNIKVKYFKVITTEGMQYEDRDKLVNKLRTIAKKELI
jgi:1-acyl-sn-glycerol-3-phosphate acyltransferase